MTDMIDSGGGYDEGYRACSCFWGRERGSLVKTLERYLPSLDGLSVLDAGCGEGKNAVYLASRGASVLALDVSEPAIENARRAWLSTKGVVWQVADIRNTSLGDSQYHVAIAYGLLHCLSNFEDVEAIVMKLKKATRPGGYNLVCAFNSRCQDLRAHPGFKPCLVDHELYLTLYSGWQIVESSDKDLVESHPNNNIVHKHSMTRIIARKGL